MNVSIQWNSGMQFEASNEMSSDTVMMDTSEENGGTGKHQTPKQMFLQSIAGCTGMDVIFILKKMREHMPSSFTMKVSASESDSQPKVFTDIALEYYIEGDIDKEKLIKAVKMSQEQYCSVAAMVRKSASMKYRLNFNGVTIAEG